MRILEFIHNNYTYDRRLARLRDHLADTLPPNVKVLDVGCGDGQLASMIMEKRSDVEIEGIDVLVRPKCFIPVSRFDGLVIPFSNSSFDLVMFSDVLHHTNDPLTLLREAVRVSRKGILLKDHTCDGAFAVPTLRLMDKVGNARHGVVLPYNYWPKHKWLKTFDALGLSIGTWTDDLKIYPGWADLIFGRSLHFVARLDIV